MKLPWKKASKSAVNRRARLRKRRRQIRVYLIATAIAGVVALILFGAHLDALQIERVIVRGAAVVPEEEIMRVTEDALAGSYGFIIPRTNTLVYPRAAIRTRIKEAFPRIRNVFVSHESLRSIEVVIREREPFAVWCGRERAGTGEEGCHYVDEEGVLYVPAPEFTGFVYTALYGPVEETPDEPAPARYMPPAAFAHLREILSRFGELGFAPVAVEQPNAADYFIYMEDGSYIKVARRQDPAVLAHNLSTAMESDAFKAHEGEQLDYIDLRFDSRIYYTFR